MTFKKLRSEARNWLLFVAALPWMALFIVAHLLVNAASWVIDRLDPNRV